MRQLRRAVVVGALVGGLALPGQAAASHTLAHKVSRLTAKVNALTAKLNCLQKYPVYAFPEYLYFDPEAPAVSVADLASGGAATVPPYTFDITALDFDYGNDGVPPDAYFVGVKRSRACPLSGVPTAANPVSRARLASVQLSRLR
ncbi:MAG: hypothetical protein ACRDPP_00130 [Gaiellaceae bacterium]